MVALGLPAYPLGAQSVISFLARARSSVVNLRPGVPASAAWKTACASRGHLSLPDFRRGPQTRGHLARRGKILFVPHGVVVGHGLAPIGHGEIRRELLRPPEMFGCVLVLNCEAVTTLGEIRPARLQLPSSQTKLRRIPTGPVRRCSPGAVKT